MDQQPISEILPGLYRAVLDAVADLEARRRRAEAAEIRAEATRIYSGAWNAAAATRLRDLALRARRVPDTRVRSRYETVLETLRRRAELEREPA